MHKPNVDVLILTALTEEQQVVLAVLERAATALGFHGSFEFSTRVRLFELRLASGHKYSIATASAHEMGAVTMGVFATRLLSSEIRPACAVLLGIAASLNAEDAGLADVPVASEVFSHDDIAVSNGRFDFRVHGFQVDGVLRRAAGAIRESQALYQRWQQACVSAITDVSITINSLRRIQVSVPPVVEPPHLVTEAGSGGPFLIRDEKFAGALRTGSASMGSVSPKLAWVEMEAHGFMKAARDAAVPGLVIKGISDAGDAGKAELEKRTGGFFRAYACSNAVTALLHILEQVPRPPTDHFLVPAGMAPRPLSPLQPRSAPPEVPSTEEAVRVRALCVDEGLRLATEVLSATVRAYGQTLESVAHGPERGIRGGRQEFLIRRVGDELRLIVDGIEDPGRIVPCAGNAQRCLQPVPEYLPWRRGALTAAERSKFESCLDVRDYVGEYVRWWVDGHRFVRS